MRFGKQKQLRRQITAGVQPAQGIQTAQTFRAIPSTTDGARAATYGVRRSCLRSSTLLPKERLVHANSDRSGRDRKRADSRPQSDAKSDALRPQSGAKSVTAPDRVGSQRFVRLARIPTNAAWLCRSLRAGTTTCDSSRWVDRDSPSRAAGPGSKNPCAAQPRGRKATPSDPPPTKRKSAPPEGCRALECSGRRGIRTPEG